MKIKLTYSHIILTILGTILMFPNTAYSRTEESFKAFPETVDKKPDIPSPMVTEGGKEMVVVFLRDSQRYTVMPVTVENGKPLLYSRKIKALFGKDRQLDVNSHDFPALARTGLHSEIDLESKKTITGLPVQLITLMARPHGFSYCGFLADDEDIISVLKADNRLVNKLGLTHPRMARPLFQVWNMILMEIEAGKMRRFSGIQHFYYNGNRISLKAEATKGWQVSIFQDEIQGKFHIQVSWDLSENEKMLIEAQYPELSDQQMTVLHNKLSRIQFSEMLPFYIMRYGFYEGHTDYRTDPIAISFIFGLKSLKEILHAFKGELYSSLTTHFTR